MYNAKKCGTGLVSAYGESDAEQCEQHLSMEQDLATVLTDNQCVLHYQPNKTWRIFMLESGNNPRYPYKPAYPLTV